MGYWYLVKGLLDHGADGKHWIIWVKEPEGNPTRDEIIKNYVNILARALGRYSSFFDSIIAFSDYMFSWL